ncbi:MAG: tRNA pseudouridine(55) synthase TruB [Candidatus Saccharibacteria bacterium]|nr:tRNA pseudouridine(55) synthase TruB [Candidatus Saccharibacteria bacterium]
MNNDGQFDRIILVDKPTGISSFGVVARIRRQLTIEAGHKVKVGHCGTLDPFATGLLILVSGKCTRRAMEFTKLDKVYQATIRLGAVSTTGDPEGEIIERTVTRQPSQAEVEVTLRGFIGTIEQTPPAFSAIKINGQRAYKLARAGKEVQMPSRHVEIYDIDLLDYSYPDLTIRTHVSSGTYIRTLAQDIGQKLGTGAYTVALRRLKIADYSVDQATPLS